MARADPTAATPLPRPVLASHSDSTMVLASDEETFGATGPAALQPGFESAPRSGPLLAPPQPPLQTHAPAVSARELQRQASRPPAPQGPPVVVVFDGGTRIDHPDLVGSIWTNPGETADGRDNDGNGIADDLHGFSTQTGTGDPLAGGFRDHGTATAGVLVGPNSPARGRALILPVADGLQRGPELDGFERAVDYAIAQKRLGANIRVFNASFGDLYPNPADQQRCERAVAKLAEADILVVVGAGNNQQDSDRVPIYPGRVRSPNALHVAALDSTGRRLRPDSDYGARTVDLAAPGTHISAANTSGGRASVSGGSIAAPAVSAAAAALFAMNPKRTAAEVRTFILAHAVPEPGLAGRVATGGRLDTEKLLAAAKAEGW